MILNRNQKGFTIVELLIVIVVIGILAALVLNSFAGVQAKARDTERQTDTKAVATQLEAFYSQAGNGSYPSTTTTVNAADVVLSNDTDVTTKLKGIDLNSLRAPGQTTNTVTMASAAGAQTPSKDQYIYQPLTSSATPTLCATTGSCVKFILWYRTEADNVVQQKASLNQS